VIENLPVADNTGRRCARALGNPDRWDDWIAAPESGMIDFQSALKAVQNLIAPQEFVSNRGEVRSANERTGGAQLRSASHFAAAFIFFT
jgi:hypothetical protein